MDKDDVHHRDALFVFQKLIKEYKDKIKFAIPSTAFFETIVVMIQKGVRAGMDYQQLREWRSQIEQKLWKLLFIAEVVNFPIIETSAFRICKKMATSSINILKTSDFIVVAQAIELDAQILTFDLQMRNRVKGAYPYVYYCAGDQTPPSGAISDETN